jgi:Escherichia/Staphylococcus phage prohead protease
MTRMMERRFNRGAEVRAKSDGHIEGHAAVFNQEYVLWDSPGYRVVETVKPGTFKRAIKEKQDVRALFNHDPNHLLGRTTSKTLSIQEDNDGLYFDCAPPDTQLGRDIPVLISRGDISGCSFGFIVTQEVVTEEKKGDQIVRTREIQDVDLFDVSPVTCPAYTGTDVNARSIEMRSAMFPAGVPASVIELVPQLRSSSDDEQACRCGCRACKSAECDECEMHMAHCGDKTRCDHSSARSARADEKKTRRVDGEDLPASAHLYVGDPDKPETWSLPWKFSSDAKTKSHLRNALARFNQTQKIPADQKAGVWKKLVRLCKKYGIAVSDQESNAWGFTPEQRADVPMTIGGGLNCQCSCAECQVGDCGNCSNDDCDDDECNHEDDGDGDDDRSAVLADMDARTRLAGLKPKA